MYLTLMYFSLLLLPLHSPICTCSFVSHFFVTFSVASFAFTSPPYFPLFLTPLPILFSPFYLSLITLPSFSVVIVLFHFFSSQAPLPVTSDMEIKQSFVERRRHAKKEETHENKAKERLRKKRCIDDVCILSFLPFLLLSFLLPSSILLFYFPSRTSSSRPQLLFVTSNVKTKQSDLWKGHGMRRGERHTRE